MPIRRLFGLLACALSLSSIPALSQTVSFIDGDGADASVYLEETEARVRVTDPAADASASVLDMVSVTLTAALSRDSEVLTLMETDRDSGVFEGRIKLVRGATPVQGGILETGFTAGPPAVFDTLTAEYGAATDTAAMSAARIQLLDEHGRPATAFADGDWVHVRLEDHVRYDDLGQRDTVHVVVRNPDMGDSENLPLTETARRTGVFEGRIRYVLGWSSFNDGILGGYIGQQARAEYDVPGYPEDAVVSVPLAGSRVEILGADGRPTALVPESSLLRLRVIHRSLGSNPAVDTRQAVAFSQLGGDQETVILTETGAETGILEGTIPMALGTAQHGDGVLQTAEDLGPPHRFDTVSVSYDDQYYSGLTWGSAVTYASETRFTDSVGKDVEDYPAGFPAHVRVEDHNANQPSVVDTIQATLESLTHGDSEILILTETGQDTGVFSGSMAVELPSGGVPGDGRLQAQADETIRALHGDAFGYTASGDLARVRSSRLQFIDADGRAVAQVLENGTARVRLEQSSCNTASYWTDYCLVTFTSRINGDQEGLWIQETGEDTGVFVGEIPVQFVFGAGHSNGVLEVANSGHPEYLPDVVTVTAGPDFASVPTVGFTLRFVDAGGEDAETFSAGDAVGLRLEDQSGNDPQVQQTEALQVRVFGSSEAEAVTLTETGAGTGVYLGSVPSRLSASPTPSDGTLDVEIGSRLLADRSHPSDLREVRDEAVVSGAAVPPEEDSPVTFRDAHGNPAASYTAGTTAYVRVADSAANAMPGSYDYVQVTLYAPATGDSETAWLRETTRDSGVFEGSVTLEATSSPSLNDGKLQCVAGEEIEAEYGDFSDQAVIRFASAEFVGEAGAPTGEVLESGVARLRVVGSSTASSITVTVQSLYGEDQESVTLMETPSGSRVFEGTVQLSFVPQGGANWNNGLLDASNSGAPDYLGDELTVTYQDAEGTAVTIPSRIRFFDVYGRVVSTFAVGERVGVRLEDHNLDDPQIKEQIQVLVREAGSGGDSNSVLLTETGYDTNVYEGSIATEDAPVASEDGTLQVQPGQVIEAERLNRHTPHPTVAQATMAGAAVVFVDAEGQPAEVYLERTRAYVRVTDSFADLDSSVNTITVTLQSFLGLDSESLTLTETGPSTGVFEGSIPLLSGGSNQNNGFLETGQDSGPPHEFDTLTASYETVSGTVSDTAGMIGSSTWFIDAYGNLADRYTAGTTAYVRVEDHNANVMPSSYDYAQVTLNAPATGDSETTWLRETTRDSGIFEGSIELEKEDLPPSPSSGDGKLQSMPGEEIEVVHDDPAGDGRSSDQAVIRFSSAEFIDEAGVPTGEVLENGVARLRVTSAPPGSSSINVTVQSRYGADQESVTLTETFSGSQVFEGTVQLSFVPRGSGSPNNGLLDASNSGVPDYLGDELTVSYQDAVGRAVTIPSRIRFFDGYGRVATTFAVGERVGVRLEDHNLDDPQVKEQIQVLVRETGSGGDSNSVLLTETGFDTNVYEGSIATDDAPPAFGDGKLQVAPGRVIEAERLNRHTSYPTVARATMSGASVVFVDAEGQPAEVYLERTRAYVRVSDTFADFNSSVNTITVTLQSLLGLDSETLSLTETGGATGVFEGSIPLLPGGSANPNNGFLETGYESGTPGEYDTLRASYESVAGTVTDTAGMTGSHTWFIDAYGNDADSYTAGTAAYMRVEDHRANAMPGSYDYAQVTLYALATGDNETWWLRETARDSGIFEGWIELEKEDYPPSPSPGDGRLQSQPGEEIEVFHTEQPGGRSSDRAVIRFATAQFIDEDGAPTGEVLENGLARLRVVGTSPGSSINVTVRSRYGADQESVTLTETSSGSRRYEGTVQLSFVPRGSGSQNNGLLDASNSAAPDYLGDELTVTYQDVEGRAVTIPSRIRFFDSYGRVSSTFAVGERVGVRLEDHNLDDPQLKEQIQVLVREAGSGDANSVLLTETGFDTNVYEGSIDTEDAPVVPGDGKLQVAPGRVIEAERLNRHTPYPTVAQAVMSGASVVFIDAQGQPAEIYFEGTRAYVRVSDTFADFSPSADTLAVTLQSFLGLDSESLTLTETGPSTGVFEGSIPLVTGGSAYPNNGLLETRYESGAPGESDTLRASYESITGTVTDTAGMIGSSTWFIDAYGNLADSYTAGTRAYVRVEDHIANAIPGSYDYTQSELYNPANGDRETAWLRETARDSGIFEGWIELEKGDNLPSPSSGDGRLRSMPGEEIQVVHSSMAGSSMDRAVIRFASAEFIDEAGAPTGKVLESGVARLRVTGTSPGSSVNVTVRSRYGVDQESVTLAETSSGSQVYEGTVQLSFVPRGSGNPNNGLLDASNSAVPDYLGDELTVTYQDAEGRAVTIPSRIRFFDSYGRLATTFAVGERVGVRLEDHNLDDSQIREQIDVLVREAGSGDAQGVVLTETGYDTNVYEGAVDTEDAPAVSGDGKLQVQAGQVIEAERLNRHTPYPTVAQAVMSGASVVFIDAQGQPAEVYFERTRAYVRVTDTFADFSPASDVLTVTLQSFLGLDSESLGLNETGPSTGVFEGSIPLSTSSASPNNGFLETAYVSSLPAELDTLVVSYESITGTVSDTAGMTGSRTWFTDLQGNPADGYAAGSTAYFRVEDHASSSPIQVRLQSLTTGDVETVTVPENVAGSGIYSYFIELETASAPSPGDNRLQSMPGEEIKVEHTDWNGSSNSSDQAVIRYAEVVIREDGLAESGVVLENGIARIEAVNTTGAPGPLTLQTRYAQDSETVGTGTIQLAFVPPGGGIPNNGILETSNSGVPEYLQEEITATYLDAVGRAVTVPSRIGFLAFAEDWPVTEYAVGSTIRVRVQDRNANDPAQVDTTTAVLFSQGDSESITLTEISADSGIFWGELPSSNIPGAPQDGTLTAGPGSVATVEHPNLYTPNPTSVQLPFNGNFAPLAVDDAVQTEEQPVRIEVLANDSDPDQDPLGIGWFTQAAHGVVIYDTDALIYQPEAGFLGTDTFTYIVNDSRGGEGRATVTVTVLQANRPPVAVPDSATLEEDGAPLTIDMLANDSDPDNDPLDVVALLTQPAFGTAVLQPDDTVVYTPNPDFYGNDGFNYQITDPDGATATATVFVAVTPVNDPPVANDDDATAAEDGSTIVAVLANDTDVESDTLDVTAVTQGTNGAVVLNTNDTATYTPNANFNGTDSFTYTVSDGNGGTDTATVNVTVNSANDAPNANDDAATVAEDGAVSIPVLGNDSDADNDNLTVTAVTQGTNGAVTLNPVTYTPNADFHGTDSFTYTISDGNGGTDSATVTVTITPINDAPVANDDAASVVEDGSVTVNVLGNDTDADNDNLTVTAVTQGANGAVTLNPVTYTPSPNFFGTDSFTYTVSDGNGGTDTATVTVTIAASNDNLTANDDSATVAEDGSVNVNVLGNDSDPENDVLNVQSVTQGTNGAVVINPDKTVTYTPNADFHGADSFTYTASDGNGGTDSATVTITVTPVNDAPVAGDDTASVVEDGSVTVTVLGNDADVDEDLLSVTSVTQGVNGTVVINPDDTVTYTPNANFNGTDSFTYTVSDGNGGEDTATVTVTAGSANDAPTADDDFASTSEDNAVTVTVLTNDSDPENDTLTVASVTQGTNGAVVINANDTVTYTPGTNFNGTDSFTCTTTDGNGGTDTATVTVTVTPVNDAPVANDDPASVEEDGSVTVTVLANDTDVENDALDVSAVTQGAHGSVVLNANDSVTYTPAANFNGTDSFTYTISDGNGGTDTASVTVTVGAANDAPVANDDTATVAEDGTVSISVLGNDSDLDNDTLTVTAVTQGANGAVTLNPVTYTPNANFFGSDSFAYTVGDGSGGTDTATVTVTVTAVNDAPAAVNDSATTTAETPVTIQVRTNDTDVDSATLTITAVTQGAHGTVAINAGQTVTYTPATAWVGPDTFTYTVSDGAGGTATATVSVDVQAPPRVSTNIQVLYSFDEGSGTAVNDTSGVGTPLNLTIANASAVTWLPGALSIDSSTLVQSSGAATKVINACKSTNEVTVEAWVLPANLSQTGPAAIVTISQNHSKRDVTLGQSGSAYNGQLRTSSTGQGGTQLNAGGTATLDLSHVVYTRSSTGAVRIYVNGSQVASGTLSGNFSGWSSYELGLGGELSGTRYWTGDLHLVAIYNRALTADEVRQNFLAGAN